METKDTFDALMQLVELHFKKFDTRRSYEWKISLGLWGAILASAAVLKDLHLPAVALWVTLPVSAVAMLSYWLLWLRPLTLRNKLAQEAGHYFERQAELALGPLSEERKKWIEKVQPLPRFWWGTYFQLVVTFILLATFNMLVWFLSPC